MRKLLLGIGILIPLSGATLAQQQQYQYVPNYGGGGTIYGPSGQTTQIVPNYGGGYTAYGPNNSTSQYVPNYGGGGTLYVHPGSQPNLQPDLSVYNRLSR